MHDATDTPWVNEMTDEVGEVIMNPENPSYALNSEGSSVIETDRTTDRAKTRDRAGHGFAQ